MFFSRNSNLFSEIQVATKTSSPPNEGMFPHDNSFKLLLTLIKTVKITVMLQFIEIPIVAT